jgi:hypothetical protein
LLSGVATPFRHFRRTASVEKPVILIGGMPRVGKTRLALKIAESAGFGVIHTDQLRKAFWEISDMAERAAERRRVYAKALAARKSGIVIEGVDLIYRNKGADHLVCKGAIKQDLSPGLELVSALSEKFGAKVFIIGCADANPDAKQAAIRKHWAAGDWTKDFSDSELANLASRIVRLSGDLRKEVQQSGFDYIELPSEPSEEHLDRAAGRILAAVRCDKTSRTGLASADCAGWI